MPGSVPGGTGSPAGDVISWLGRMQGEEAKLTVTDDTADAGPAAAVRVRKRTSTPGELQRAVGERYRLVTELGRGGFGVVWRAEDRRTGTPVCIKFLWPDMARGFALVRFKREFWTARRLQHSHCVHVFDLGQSDGLYFFSMEYVPGTSLRAAADLRGNVPTVAAIGLQILAALDEIHGQAIVHRDIKPHNILLSPNPGTGPPVAKLTDFGIAKVGDLDDDDTVRSLRGSPPYLAPELVSEGIVDARSDLYGLGVTLYEVLSGRHPLGEARTLPEWLAQIRTQEPVPLRDVAPAVPAPVADVIMRLCAKDPAARYRSAAQAYDELGSWLTAEARDTVPELAPLTRAPYLAAPRLIGRRDEQERIASFLKSNLCPGGAPRSAAPLLVLSGPAGVGKSRLIQWLLHTAEQYEPVVLLGRARSEIGVPFESVAPILQRLLLAKASRPDAGAGVEVTKTAVTGPEWSTISGLLTSNSDSDTGDRASQRAAGPSLRQLLHRFTDRLLRAAEGQPTLIVVEDVQWCDHETLELLKLWTQTIAVDRSDGRNLPIGLVLTHRPVEGDQPLAALVTDLEDEARAVAIDISAPGPVATVELAAELLMCAGDYALMGACQRLFGDRAVTPLYVGQVLRLLLARGLLRRQDGNESRWDFSELTDDALRMIPATVEEAIGERAAPLSIYTKALLSAAAVLGRRFGLVVASATAGLDVSLARDCLGEAERAGFISEPAGQEGPAGDTGFVFVHDRLREALYGGLSAKQRIDLHGKAAAALIAGSARKGREVAADLAHHFHAAGDGPRAYRFSVLAGQQALHAQQFSRASDLLAQAVAHADQQGRRLSHGLLCRLGDAAALALQINRAEDAYRRALDGARDCERRMRVLTRLGELYDRAHQQDRAVAHYRQALAEGVPWYLRGSMMLWLLLAAALTLMAIGPPSLLIAFCRLVLWRQPPSRCAALQRSAVAGLPSAIIQDRFGVGLSFGVVVVVAGFAAERQRHGRAFALAAAAMELTAALLSMERNFRRWGALADVGDVRQWDADESYFYHFARGAAALFLAREQDALAGYRQVFAQALARKDVLRMESAATSLVRSLHLFARSDEALGVLDTVRRFARAENHRALVPVVVYNEGLVRSGRLDFTAARSLLGEYGRQRLQETSDIITERGRLYAELRNAVRLDGPSESVGHRALELLADCERQRVILPVVSYAAFGFALAVEVWAQLARERPVPSEVARQLRRARRRVRPIDGKGPWRRPYWLVGYAMYDAMQGKTRRARRQLERGLDELARNGADTYLAWLCTAGLRVFAPDGELARCCADELARVVARRPELRDGVERERRLG
jgi:serine/threonine protein kinase